MQTSLLLRAVLLAAGMMALPFSLSAQIINVDFLAKRGSEAQSPNYVGQGYAGGGTVFNGLVANDASSTDKITVTGTNLLTASGGASTVGFSISPVGSDDQSGSSTLGALPGNGSYLFINSANNSGFYSVNFTISGLGTAPTADLYFYTSNTTNLNTGVFSVGGTKTTTTTNGIYNSFNTEIYLNVPITAGTIAGTFSVPNHSFPSLLSGFTIVEVPEPSTWAMLGISCLVLLARWRRASL